MKFLGYTIAKRPPIDKGYPRGNLKPVYVMQNLADGDPGELKAVIDEKTRIHSYLHAMWYIFDKRTKVAQMFRNNWWLYALIIAYIIFELIRK